jgi:hypothetical protein
MRICYSERQVIEKRSVPRARRRGCRPPEAPAISLRRQVETTNGIESPDDKCAETTKKKYYKSAFLKLKYILLFGYIKLLLFYATAHAPIMMGSKPGPTMCVLRSSGV